MGFSQKEVSVYLAALELGKASANFIARRSKVNRATTYAILEGLDEKGLITSLLEGGERRFLAESPERILSLLHLQKEELEERQRLAQSLMGQLQAFYNSSGAKPRIRYIESLEGLRLMHREYETLDDEIIQLIGYDAFSKLQDRGASREHQTKLKHQKKKVRAIVVSDSQPIIFDGLDVEYVTVPPSFLDIQGEMTVCGNRLALFAFQDGVIAIEIVSQTIADTARAALELAWRQAQQIKSKSTT